MCSISVAQDETSFFFLFQNKQYRKSCCKQIADCNITAIFSQLAVINKADKTHSHLRCPESKTAGNNLSYYSSACSSCHTPIKNNNENSVQNNICDCPLSPLRTFPKPVFPTHGQNRKITAIVLEKHILKPQSDNIKPHMSMRFP